LITLVVTPGGPWGIVRLQAYPLTSGHDKSAGQSRFSGWFTSPSRAWSIRSLDRHQWHVVTLHLSISRQQGQSVAACLGDKHPVEWIAMQRGKDPCLDGVP
jgi:hypothetical protein